MQGVRWTTHPGITKGRLSCFSCPADSCQATLHAPSCSAASRSACIGCRRDCKHRQPQPLHAVELARKSYTVLIGRLGSRHCWQDALASLREMRQASLEPNDISYGAAAAAAGSSWTWQQTIELLQQERAMGITLSLITWSIAAAAARGTTCWEWALRALRGAAAATAWPDTIVFNSALRAAEAAHRWEWVLVLLQEMQGSAVRPDAFSCSTTVGACEAGHEWVRSRALLRELRVRRVEPNIVSYNIATGAAQRYQRWEQAVNGMQEVRELGFLLEVPLCNSLLGACEKGRQWQGAIELLWGMSAWTLEPGVITCSASVSALEKGRQWRCAVAILQQMRAMAIVPNVITYNAAMSACERGQAWACTLGLLADLPAQGLAVDGIGYTAALAACAAGHQWQRALGLLAAMRADELRPDVLSYGALLAVAEETGQLAQELALLGSLGAGGGVLGLAARTAAEARLDATRPRPGLAGRLSAAVAAWPRLAVGRTPKAGLVGTAPRLKELRLLQHVLASVRPGDPAAACGAMEAFGECELARAGLWLKSAAGSKAEVLLAAARASPPGGCVLEIGTYCGYSAMRLAAALPGVRVATLEANPVHVVIARSILAHAGLGGAVDVWTGHSQDLLPRLVDRYRGRGHLRLGTVFMDQRGSRYHEDLAVLEDHSLLMPGAVLIADNVLKPGAPLFLWRATSGRTYCTEVVCVTEFAMPSEDWMVVSARPQNAIVAEPPLPPPVELLQFSSDSDLMRERATGPGRGVSFAEWAAFAAAARELCGRAGICATAEAPSSTGPATGRGQQSRHLRVPWGKGPGRGRTSGGSYTI